MNVHEQSMEHEMMGKMLVDDYDETRQNVIEIM